MLRLSISFKPQTTAGLQMKVGVAVAHVCLYQSSINPSLHGLTKQLENKIK